MKVGSIYVDIKGDTSPLDKAIIRAKRVAESGAKKVQSAFDTVKGSTVAIGAAAAAAAVGFYALNNMMSEAKDLANIQEKEERKLEAVLKATGNAAGFTADELKRLASQYQSVTTTGDETILSGMSILATFKNIRKEGFERATMAALDMAEVMGQDLNSAMTMIGKAVNDPIKGISALTRVGVTFTEQQKEQIKELQGAGEMYKAQSVILDELESQFGGVASAMVDLQSGALTQLGNTWGDVMEVIGQTETKNESLTESYRELDSALQDQSENISSLFSIYADAKTVLVDLAIGFVNTADEIRAFVGAWQAFKDLTRATITAQQYFSLDDESLIKYGKLRNALAMIADTQRDLTVARMKWLRDEEEIAELEEQLAYQQEWRNELLAETTKKTNEQTDAVNASTEAVAEQMKTEAEQAKAQKKILDDHKKAAEEKAAAEEEMYEAAGFGAEAHYAKEAGDLVQKVSNWQKAGADVYESEQWLYDQLGDLSEEAWAKGETAAGLAMDSLMAQSSNLVTEMNETVGAGMDKLDEYGLKIGGLDGSSIGITASLDGSGVISGIDTLIEKFDQLRISAAAPSDTGTTPSTTTDDSFVPDLNWQAQMQANAPSGNTVNYNFNQNISRSDVDNITTEQQRQEALD